MAAFRKPRVPARSQQKSTVARQVRMQQQVRTPAPSRARPPSSPPPGSYDPAIDAQVGQAARGLGDLLSDYLRDYGEPGTALGGRSGEDYTVGKAAIQQGLDRALADLLQGRQRGAEDYGQSVTGLQRGFAQLGAQQTQAARAAGVARGGALAQALAKRSANEQIARQPLDTNFARFNADSATAEGRVREGAALDFSALDRGLLRGAEDASTGLARAQRENAQFGVDASALRFYQADLPLGGEPDAAGAPRSPFARVQAPLLPAARRRPLPSRASGGLRPRRLVRGPMRRVS
jgi:hypothetical protein